MAHDVVIAGNTYTATESIAMRTANGDVVQFYPDAVRYVAQDLTEEQKVQARANIGAATVSDVLAALPIGEGVRY